MHIKSTGNNLLIRAGYKKNSPDRKFIPRPSKKLKNGSIFIFELTSCYVLLSFSFLSLKSMHLSESTCFLQLSELACLQASEQDLLLEPALEQVQPCVVSVPEQLCVASEQVLDGVRASELNDTQELASVLVHNVRVCEDTALHPRLLSAHCRIL